MVLLRRALVVWFVLAAAATAGAQADRSLEYQVKAAYLYNFVKYVEWPPRAASGPITICVAGRTPLSAALIETVRGESVEGRQLVTHAVSEPDPGCSVLFIPENVPADPFLRAVRGTPTLTVGESAEFLGRGGMINFVLDGGKVRFDVNTEPLDRVELRISSRMLRLARNVEPRGHS